MRRINQEATINSNSLGYHGWVVLALLAAMLSGSVAGAAEPATTDLPHRTLLVSLADRKLALIEEGRLAKVYDVAVGKPWTPSPTGKLHIVNKIVGPTYYHHGQVIRPGRSNPLGPRWIGLSRSGYGIHGTNDPPSIGKAASHGCFRMRTADVEELFARVQVGDAVDIHRAHDEAVSRFFPESSRKVPPSKAAVPSRTSAAMVITAIAGEL